MHNLTLETTASVPTYISLTLLRTGSGEDSQLLGSALLGLVLWPIRQKITQGRNMPLRVGVNVSQNDPPPTPLGKSCRTFFNWQMITHCTLFGPGWGGGVVMMWIRTVPEMQICQLWPSPEKIKVNTGVIGLRFFWRNRPHLTTYWSLLVTSVVFWKQINNYVFEAEYFIGRM